MDWKLRGLIQNLRVNTDVQPTHLEFGREHITRAIRHMMATSTKKKFKRANRIEQNYMNTGVDIQIGTKYHRSIQYSLIMEKKSDFISLSWHYIQVSVWKWTVHENGRPLNIGWSKLDDKLTDWSLTCNIFYRWCDGSYYWIFNPSRINRSWLYKRNMWNEKCYNVPDMRWWMPV